MRRKKKLWVSSSGRSAANLLLLSILTFTCLLLFSSPEQHPFAMLLLTTSCLSGAPGCVCSWKSGKFVTDCSNQSLQEVPRNDYDLLTSAANSQMPTLNRDIQQLNLANNNLSKLSESEFMRKKFRNLQKIYLSGNQVSRIHPAAFHLLTGLVELDLSENLITSVRSDEAETSSSSTASLAATPTSSTTTTTTTTTSLKRWNNKTAEDFEEAVEDKIRGSSFLNELTSLRSLSLAANLLQRLDSFTFSPLKQLRQLHLSRNKISFIDKRAFDGLRLLNVLHLDGNKLAHLDGAILLQLPKLHSIQLGGQSNKWRCDCRLRRLLHLLQNANILQDEPQCQQQQQHTFTATKEQEEDKQRLSWKNMKLQQFECPPRLASQLMVGFARTWPSHLETALRSALPDAGSGERAYLHRHYLWTDLADQQTVLELTCALPLSDELDLAHNQLQWWQLAEQHQPATLLWQSPGLNSSAAAAAAAAAATMKDEPANKRLQYTVIDYVTRANAPDQRQQQQQPASDSSRSSIDDKHDEQDEDELMGRSDGPNLVRVVHLIANTTKERTRKPLPASPSQDSHHHEEQVQAVGNVNLPLDQQQQQQQRLFLCRITNSAGRLDVLFAVSFDSTRHQQQQQQQQQTQPQLDHLRRRQAMRKRLAAAQSVAHWLPLLSSASGWSLERAKAALAEELLQPARQPSPLFIPIYLPDELARAVGSGLGSGGLDVTLARSLNQVDHLNQRTTATRQTNGSTGLTGSHRPKQVASQEEGALLLEQDSAGSNRSARSLNLMALDLIGSYTSGRRSGAGDLSQVTRADNDDDKEQVVGGLEGEDLLVWNIPNIDGLDPLDGTLGLSSQPASFSQVLDSPQPLGGRIRSLSRLVYARYLDRWTQLAMGEAPLLLGICAGLLAGCLLSMLVVLRLRCAHNQRRVADCSSANQLHSGAASARLKSGSFVNTDYDEACEEDPAEDGDNEEGENDAESDGLHDGLSCGGNAQVLEQVSPSGGADSDKPASAESSSCVMYSDASQRKLIAPGSSSDDLCQAHLLANNSRRQQQPLFYKTLGCVQTRRKRNNLLMMSSAGGLPVADTAEQQLFVMPPHQQEMQELSVSSLCHHQSSSSSQASQLQPVSCAYLNCPTYELTRAGQHQEPSDADSSLIAYHLNENACRQLTTSYPMNHQQQHLWRTGSAANNTFGIDDHFTNEDSSSSLMLSPPVNSTSHLQPQQQSLVMAPPKLRSLDADTLLLPYLGAYSNEPAQVNTCGHYQQHQDPHSLYLLRQPPHFRSPVDSAQLNYSSSSMASPVPSNSSSLIAANGNQQYMRQDMLGDAHESASGEQNSKMYYLDDALQLLNTSTGLCFREQDLTPGKLNK